MNNIRNRGFSNIELVCNFTLRHCANMMESANFNYIRLPENGLRQSLSATHYFRMFFGMMFVAPRQPFRMQPRVMRVSASQSLRMNSRSIPVSIRYFFGMLLKNSAPL